MIKDISPASIWDSQMLYDFFETNNIKKLHAGILWKLILKYSMNDFSSLFKIESRLPTKLKDLLIKNFVITSSRIVEKQASRDGKTLKLLIELINGSQIETVLIRHKDTRSGGHNSVCVSSQVGCNMNCRFCDTGSIGLKYHLTSGEILEQFLHVQNSVSVISRNVVFMGMGEPLDNWNNVRNAIKGFHDKRKFNLSYKKITLSTVGIFSKMKLFSDAFPEVNLALSLHSPTQKLRIQIVPKSKSYSVGKLIKALHYHIFKTNRKVFIEYICIGNINCSMELQHKLGIIFQRFKREKILINLIPYVKRKSYIV